GNIQAAQLFVETLKSAKRMDQLGKFLKNYVDSFPSRLWAMVEYVHLLSRLDVVSNAEPALERAVRDEDSTADMILLYAKVLDSQKKYPEAIALLKRGSSRFPIDPRIRFDIALCHEHAGELTQAERSYESVPARDPEVYFKARVNLALLQEEAGKLNES